MKYIESIVNDKSVMTSDMEGLSSKMKEVAVSEDFNDETKKESKNEKDRQSSETNLKKLKCLFLMEMIQTCGYSEPIGISNFTN